MNRRPSKYWLLLTLPVAAFGGWFLGNLSTNADPPKPAVVAGTASTTSLAATPASSSRKRTEPLESSWSSYEDALAESRRNGKPLMLDFNAEWCGPCRAMKSELFNHPGYGRTVRTAVIPVSLVDRRREDGRNSDEVETLQDRYGIEAFPTLVVWSPATGRKQMRRGFGDSQEMLAWIQSAAHGVR